MPSDILSLRSAFSSTSSYNRSFLSHDDKPTDNTVLYSELRLIERNEGEINVCWKGAHMMLFFMAFVFGSLCTCCFHRLMYMFDEKCVLFPKVVSHYSIHRIVYDFFSYKPRLRADELKESTDYVSTHWADNSVCYLPTYVPLVSGLAGLVWTTMFLMCSSGTSNVTGAQRHWRALPSMFFFSITMSGLCIYASYVTHSGLTELCSKMAEATGSPACTYNINVATLVYERRIHSVYQATRLSIVSAWLHTSCWVLSTLLVVARVLLAVDFTLVHVKAQLVGNLDDILQKHEKQIDSFNAESATPLRFDIDEDDSEVELFTTSNAIKVPKKPEESSELSQSSTSPRERKDKLLDKYMHSILRDLLKTVGKRDQATQTQTALDKTPTERTDVENTELIAKEFIKKLRGKLTKEINEFEHHIKSLIKNKNENDDTEINPQKMDDDKKNSGTNKSPINEIDINYAYIEQEAKISSREIYEINFEESTSNKTEEKYKRDRVVSLELLNVQYHTQLYGGLKILDETRKTEILDINKKEKNQDPPLLVEDEPRSAKEFDTVDKNQKKEEKIYDELDKKDSHDTKDNNKKDDTKDGNDSHDTNDNNIKEL